MRAAREYAAIPTRHSFRRCVRLLGQGTSICLGGDRDIGVGGVKVEFLGRPAPFPAGPARLALAAGAVVLPMFTVRSPNRDLTIVLEPPIEPPTEGDRNHKALAMTQGFAKHLERYVRAYPEQWGVFDRVWGEEKPTGAAEGDGHNNEG